ncbi:MAG: NAD(P)-dependent oxidoreductase [Vicinamibacteria bacterium]
MKALITAPFHPDGIRLLRNHMEVVHESWKETSRIYLDASSLAVKLLDLTADVLIVEADMVYAETFDAVALRLIGSARANPYNIDVEAATRKRVPVFYAPGRNAEAVADLTIGLMIALLRKLFQADRLLRSGKFSVGGERELADLYTRFTGRELGAVTVGLVGLGDVGSRVASRLHQGFQTRILVHDPFIDPGRIRAVGAEPVPLDGLLQESDIVSIHASVTEKTQGLIGARELGLMRRSAYLVNTARSFIVDENSLHGALKERKIAGAALDVFDVEPVDSSNRFLDLDNVIVTPHIGGLTEEVVLHQSMILAGDIDAYLKGGKPRFVKNPETLPESQRA